MMLTREPKAEEEPTASIERVKIVCPADDGVPGGRRATLVIEYAGGGEKPIAFHGKDLRDSGAKQKKRTRGVFSTMQRPSWQAYSLLIWLKNREREYDEHEVPGDEIVALRGWSSAEESVSERLKKIIGDSSVLECTGSRVKFKDPSVVVFEGDEREWADILHWAQVRAKDPEANEPGRSPESKQAPPDPGRKRDLTRLKAEVHEVLQRNPGLTAELSKTYRGNGQGGLAVSVTGALLAVPAKEVTEHVVRIVEQGRHQDAVRDLLWVLLPLAVDWEKVLAQASAAGPEGGALVLPLRTATVAEIVLARIEARRCRYAPFDRQPQGALHVPIPAADRAAIIDLDGAHLVDAVLINLLSEKAPKGFRERDEHFWQGIRNECADDDEFKIRAADELNALQHRDARPYLLIFDAMLGKQTPADVDRYWDVAKGALGKALPGLRLVRLQGRIEELKHESGFVPLIRTVRDGC
jgi:hypothetical protein